MYYFGSASLEGLGGIVEIFSIFLTEELRGKGMCQGWVVSRNETVAGLAREDSEFPREG